MTEIAVKSYILTTMCIIFTAFMLLLTVSVDQANAQPRKYDKGLDEQVQDIKSEALSIAKELDQLEERLLYPAHTQISLFVSLRKGVPFSLDSVDIELDGNGVAYHLYTPKEVEALILGGVQRIFTGNVAIGQHELKVTMRGKSATGDNIRLVKSFPIEKKVEPGIAELMLSEKSITLINR